MVKVCPPVVRVVGIDTLRSVTVSLPMTTALLEDELPVLDLWLVVEVILVVGAGSRVNVSPNVVSTETTVTGGTITVFVPITMMPESETIV